ncbi:MAG: fluoroacetyl-CoA thioesterase [Hyphomicrobiaceae bacterium]|jgi:fluoroacetyl-CoA thioesterase
MKDSLQLGLSSTATYTVTEDMSPPHLPMKVLSTPSMIGLIEQTCLLLAQEHLDGAETTVGIHVCVSHQAAAAAGQDIQIGCELTAIDRKKLSFTTTVACGDKTVSVGTHDRFVVGG